MYKTVSIFSGNVILRNWPLKFLVPIVLDLTEKCLKISQKLHKGDKNILRNVKKKKKEKKIQNLQMTYFSPYANFSCPYLKIGLCDVFPVLLECITILSYSYSFQKMQERCTCVSLKTPKLHLTSRMYVMPYSVSTCITSILKVG